MPDAGAYDRHSRQVVQQARAAGEMYAWSASLSSKAQTVVGIHRGLTRKVGRLPSQGGCALDLVIGFFVGELELRPCRSALRYDLFMLEQLRFPPNAAVGVIVSGFAVPETVRCTDFFDDGRGRTEPAPVILPIAGSCDAAKFGRRYHAFAETLILEIPRLLRPDRRATGNQYQLVVGWQLHDFAWGKQRSGGFLPRHHQVPQPG